MDFVDGLERLERLRQQGVLSDGELEQAKAKPLSGSGSGLDSAEQMQLSELKKELELARLDEAWRTERERYMIDMRYGRRSPNGFAGWTGISIGVMLGMYLIWQGTKSGWTDGTPITAVSWIFSTALVFIFVWSGNNEREKSAQYSSSERTYHHQREQISRSK